MANPVQRLERYLSGWPEPALSLALLLAAGVLICLALEPEHRVAKAVALAYVLLP